ncbi:MAG: amidohydrolase/deacetylase family metallohydrolase [Alphaproteobacteria bacterium]|nr:amidohydrolase/deacetylase family metallohydrolase [Alphaproteobacteria bacterium]
MFDLVLKGGRVIDPAQGIDAVSDVAFKDGRVAAVGSNLGEAADTRDVSGKIVTPGLIDLHTHVYWGGTSIGVDPDSYARRAGCTTLIDAGTAGPGNLPGFREHIIRRADVRILPFMNISYPGIFAFSPHVMVGECEDLRLLHPRACRDVGRENLDLIVGIKVRVGKSASGESGLAPLDMGLEVADHLGVPVMAHLDHPPPYRSEVMPRLRKGDILTHCYRPFPNAPITGDGRVQDDVRAARERGVIFDIGHGGGSFGYETAVAMMRQGFSPDVISSDVHVLSENGPAFDQLVTMSKFLAIGMPLVEVIRASTINPARAVRKTDRGTLTPGTLGDATILDIEKGKFAFPDVLGEIREGSEHLRCKGIVLGGRWWRD